MAGSALTIDSPVSQVEKNRSSRAPAHSSSPPEQSTFERVREDISHAEKSAAATEPKSQQSKSREIAGEGEKADTADAGPVEAPPGKDTESVSTGATPAGPGNTPEIPSDQLTRDGEVFALLPAPVQPLVGSGKALPSTPAQTATPLAAQVDAPVAGVGVPVASQTGSGEVPGGAAGLQKIFAQMAQGKGGEAGHEAGRKALGELDLQSFKTSLAEAVDTQSGRSADAPTATLMTGQRGLEIREGSALIRQYSTTVDTPVQQGDWGDKMSGKISWLASQGISFAEIHINPPDMGPIDVRVSVQNDQASVAVHAQNASVRDLLELNSQRLRDMLQDGGLNLAKMDVSDQSTRQQPQTGDGETEQGDQHASDEDESSLVSLDGETMSTGEIQLKWQSEVDTYA